MNEDTEDLTPVSRGYNYVKPNWQDLLVELFREAFNALDSYASDPGIVAVKITKLYHALQFNAARDAEWRDRWTATHSDPNRVKDLEYRGEELGLLVELAMSDGMVWPKPESWDASATEALMRP